LGSQFLESIKLAQLMSHNNPDCWVLFYLTDLIMINYQKLIKLWSIKDIDGWAQKLMAILKLDNVLIRAY